MRRRDEEQQSTIGPSGGERVEGSPPVSTQLHQENVAFLQFLQKHDLQTCVDLESADRSNENKPRQGLAFDPSGKRYHLGEILGRGGMGVILRAKDLNCRRTVAMKVMDPALHHQPNSIVRFIEEAQITSQLEHPNIVPVHDFSVDDGGSMFYTMKHVKGQTLAEVIEALVDGDEAVRQRYSLNTLLNVFQRICDAMAFAHARGVIHRDLKPANIMLGDYGEVLVLDWGLGKVLSRDVEPEHRPTDTFDTIRGDEESSDLFLTRAGTVMGTPAFMAPEQADPGGAFVSIHTDIYALGAILYNILTLTRPFSDASTKRFLERKTKGDFLHPSTFSGSLPHCPNASAPSGLVAVCLKAMSLDPQDRYGQVDELQKELDAWQGGFATHAEDAGTFRQIGLLLSRHRLLVACMALILLSLFVGLGVALRQRASVLHHLSQRIEAEALRMEQGVSSAPLYLDLSRKLLQIGDAAGSADALSAAEERDASLAGLRLQRSRLLILKGALNESVSLLSAPRAASPSVDTNEQRAEGQLVVAIQSVLKYDPIQASPQAQMAFASRLAGAIRRQGDPVLAAQLLHRAGLSDESTPVRMEAARREMERANPGVLISTNCVNLDHQIVGFDFSGLSLTDLSVLEGLPLTLLTLKDTGVSDLTPLQAMPLRSLDLQQTRVTDLSALEGMPLEVLGLWGTRVQDFSVLADMPLVRVSLYGTPIQRLDVLQGKSLEWLTVGHSDVADLRPLSGMPLRYLNIRDTRVTDIRPLQGMPLEHLQIQDTDVSDLTVLKGMPLRQLDFRNTRVRDFRPIADLPLVSLRCGQTLLHHLSELGDYPQLTHLSLRGCERLENLEGIERFTNLVELAIPNHIRDTERVHALPHLQYLDYQRGGSMRTVDQFFSMVAEEIPLSGKLETARLALERANGVSIPPARMIHSKTWKGFDLRGLPIHDLRPLKGLPLTDLFLDHIEVKDISPLAQMPLERLTLFHNSVQDLSPLQGAPLRYLTLLGVHLNNEDMQMLLDCPIQELTISETGVTDLSFTEHMPLRVLRVRCQNLKPNTIPIVLGHHRLDRLEISDTVSGFERLYTHAGLRFISTNYDKWTTPVDVFWKRYFEAHGAP